MEAGLVLIIGFLLFVGVALVAVLLAYERTRPAGSALLAAGACAGLLLMVLMFFRVQSDPAAPAVEVSRPIVESGPATAGTGQTSPSAIRPPKKPPGVLPAMGRSLAKAAAESGVGQATQTVKNSPSVLASALKALGKAVAKERKSPHTGEADTAGRPPWVDAEAGVVDGDYQVATMVGPFATRQECDDAEPQAVEETAADYIERYLEPGAVGSVRLSPEYLAEHVVVDSWEEERMTDFGAGIGPKPMIRRYVLLRFDREVNEELKRRQHRAMVQRRLGAATFGLVAILAALALTFAYLKINLATGGRHRGRLRAGTAAVIAVAVAVGLLLA